MELMTQFSVFLANKPGILAQVMRQLAHAKVDIIAMTMMDSSEHGVLRLVATNPEPTRAAMAELNLPVTETDVLMIEMTNKPGSLADICHDLAAAHININYAYCTSGARNGKSKGIFKVADIKKAQKVLLRDKITSKRTTARKLRRPTAIRA